MGLFIMGLRVLSCTFHAGPAWPGPSTLPSPPPESPRVLLLRLPHPESAMPREQGSPPLEGHHLGRPSAPSCLARGTPSWPSPLPCQDMALQNALYTGDLARLQDLFPPHSTADLLLESRAAEPRWSSHQRGEGLPAGGDTRPGLG